MQNVFELYLRTDKTSAQDWLKFYATITRHIGAFKKISFYIVVQDTIVHYLVACDSDLGVLSNNIDIGVLRPVDASMLQLPAASSKERFVQFVEGGNALDMNERMSVKRGKKMKVLELNVRRIGPQKPVCTLSVYFDDGTGSVSKNTRITGAFPAHLFAIDFEENARYVKKTINNYLSLEKTIHLFEPANYNSLFSVNTFPYYAQDYYLPIHNYEFDKHSFIIGASGSGKSKFIQLYIDRLAQSQLKMNYRVVVIDPHDALKNDLSPIPGTKIIDFNSEAAELFGSDSNTDVSASTELTTTLMKSLIGEATNPRLERVLRFSLYVLFVGQTMSLSYLKRFLTETELRNEIMGHVSTHVPDNINKFFATDYNEIRTTYYNDAILPIVALVDEMQLQPALVSENEQQLSQLIQNNFLTVFSLNKVSMGERVVRTAAGLLIQQIFLLAQARVFNQKIILVIDEVSVVQNPALAAILAEARKFGLSVILTQQYFGQVEKSLRDAIFANVMNYYCFRVSEEDAIGLAGNLVMEIPKEIMDVEVTKGLKEEQIRVQYMTSLNPRECLVRISANGQILPCFKARTVDIASQVPQHSIQSADLINYKQPTTKRAKKFVEGSKHAPLPSVGHRQEIPVKADLPELNTRSGPFNPEADQSFYTNHEIDPIERKAKKEEQAKRLAKHSKFVLKHTIHHSPQQPASIPIPLRPPDRETSRGQPGMSLSELLASQSSKNNKKA